MPDIRYPGGFCPYILARCYPGIPTNILFLAGYLVKEKQIKLPVDILSLKYPDFGFIHMFCALHVLRSIFLDIIYFLYIHAFCAISVYIKAGLQIRIQFLK